jgi:hypothetical protein
MTVTNMSPISLRRVVARQAKQAALTASKGKPISEAKLLANQQNAQKSTGARTEAGHRASSMNALKHGMTAKLNMLVGSDAVDYQNLLDSHIERHSPVGDEENELIHIIVENSWKLIQGRVHHAALYEVGRLEHPTLFAEVEDQTRRKALTDTKIEMLYAKDFKNLNLQENRIRRQHDRDLARLTLLQNERIARPQLEAKAAADENIRQVELATKLANHCKKTNQPFIPAEFGFNLTPDEWEYVSDRYWGYFHITGEHLDMNQMVSVYRAAQEAPPKT